MAAIPSFITQNTMSLQTPNSTNCKINQILDDFERTIIEAATKFVLKTSKLREK